MRTALALAVVGVLLLLPGSAQAANCGVTSTGKTPLSDLTGTYQGYPGQLYPGGDSPPATYAAEGLSQAALVIPRDGHGAPIPSGKIGLIGIGMSNARMEFDPFKSYWMSGGGSVLRNPAVKIANGALNGATLDQIAYPSSPMYASFWANVNSKMLAAGLYNAQVQALWFKDTIMYPAQNAGAFPASAQLAKTYMRAVIDTAASKFPNLRLVYMSTRIYAGYASTTLSPEPWAYEDGFVAKWLIEDRIANPGSRPWIAWGPYMWADGLVPRSDGYVSTRTWACSDLQPDGTHPTSAGTGKVAGALSDFFTTDPTAEGWFLKP